MEDDSLIVTLVSKNYDYTPRAFQQAHYAARYLPPFATAYASRECTPFSGYVAPIPDDERHRLQLRLDAPPRAPEYGFVFGYGEHCDVQLIDQNDVKPGDRQYTNRVSEYQFAIGFDAQERLILHDWSASGAILSYRGGTDRQLRRHFSWILFPGHVIEVSIPDAAISFEIQVAPHKDRQAFSRNLRKVFPEPMKFPFSWPPEGSSALTTPSRYLKMLSMASRNASIVNSGRATELQRPVYLQHEQIGSGMYGTIRKAINASTGSICAIKTYKEGSPWQREIDAMQRVQHENIVRFLGLSLQPLPSPPQLVMEWIPFGSLADTQQHSPIKRLPPNPEGELWTFLSQALSALMYLHDRRYIHRDIKPSNILVASRSPLLVKLADFGLVKYDRDGESALQTFAGTTDYIAPEIWRTGFSVGRYTVAADIYSLGVVTLQLICGLPQWSSSSKPGESREDVVYQHAELYAGDFWGHVLTHFMLPQDRLTAAALLDHLRVCDERLRVRIERPHRARQAAPSGSAPITLSPPFTSLAMPAIPLSPEHSTWASPGHAGPPPPRELRSPRRSAAPAVAAPPMYSIAPNLLDMRTESSIGYASRNRTVSRRLTDPTASGSIAPPIIDLTSSPGTRSSMLSTPNDISNPQRAPDEFPGEDSGRRAALRSARKGKERRRWD